MKIPNAYRSASGGKRMNADRAVAIGLFLIVLAVLLWGAPCTP